MKILVIGATGFIGSNLCRRLRVHGHHVTGLARNEPGRRKLAHIGVEAVSGDLENLDGVIALTRSVDAVIYTAQLMLAPEKAAVAALVDAMRDAKQTFIFTSGTGVLSERTDGEWSEKSYGEDDVFVPSKYIGARKETEDLVRAASRDSGLRSIVIRPPLVWGHGACGTVANYYRSGRTTGSVCYIGAGLNLYSHVHVDDLVEVYRLALERGQSGALYHAVAGEIPNRFIAEEVARVMGLAARSVSMDEAMKIWDRFTAIVVLGTCSRSRSPRTRSELGWAATQVDFMGDVANPRYMEVTA